jgi:hypothetical protein
MKPAAGQLQLFDQAPALDAKGRLTPEAPKCAYCDQPATTLCDYQLRPMPPDWRKNPGFGLFTCDKPMCDAHAVQVGTMIVCTRGGRHGDGCCQRMTIDHCPEHAKEN